jgi:hypothetical protein
VLGHWKKLKEYIFRQEIPDDAEAGEGSPAQQCGGRQNPLILGMIAVPQHIDDAKLPMSGRQLAAEILRAVNRAAGSRAVADDEQLDLEDQGSLIVSGISQYGNSPTGV